MPRYPSLLQPPLAFARPAAGGGGPDGLLAGYATALRAGATGLEADVHLTSDRQPMLHPEPSVRSGLRRRPLGELTRDEVRESLLGLDDLYRACGTGFDLALSLPDLDAAAAVVSTARRAGGDAEARLWLCAADHQALATWRTVSPRCRLVEVTRLRKIDGGPERRASVLAEAGIDAVHLPEADWTAGLTTLFHRFGRLALAGAVTHRRQLDALLALGVDAVSSEHADRMAEALAALAAPT